MLQLGLAPLALRILIEIEEQVLEAAQALADDIAAVLTQAGVRRPVLLHGMDTTVWPLVDEAFRRGFSTRVGLEDGAALPDGSMAASNAALVAAAIDIRKG